MTGFVILTATTGFITLVVTRLTLAAVAINTAKPYMNNNR